MGETFLQNYHLAGKNTQVHGYMLYTKCHRVQSQEVVALGPLVIVCEWEKKRNWILVFKIQSNNNC